MQMKWVYIYIYFIGLDFEILIIHRSLNSPIYYQIEYCNDLGLRSYAAWLCLNPKWADNVLTGAIAFVNCMNIETFPSSYKILSCSTLKSIIHLPRTFIWEPQGWASFFKIEKKAFVTWYYWHLLWTVWILTSKSIFLRFELFIVQGDLSSQLMLLCLIPNYVIKPSICLKSGTSTLISIFVSSS